jgi:hypothetical protein
MTRLTGLAVCALVPVALVACNGKSTGNAVASAPQAGAIGFAQCMRSHSVVNWPDPNSSGVFDKTKVTPQELKVSTSQLQAAQTACQSLLPPATATQQRLNAAQALQFSQCVRSHGVPNFPDPGGDGRIPDPASVGIDQGSPQFQAANVACAQYRPPYIPSNAAYLAYAATASAS